MATGIESIVVTPGITAGSPFAVGDVLYVAQTSPAIARATPNIFVDTTVSPQQVQIGPIASNSGATVIGTGATVTGGGTSTNVVVIGTNATVNHQAAVSIGFGSSVAGGADVAVGLNATVSAVGGVAVGQGASSASNGTAVGSGATSQGPNGQCAIGSSANAKTFGNAFGNSSTASDTRSKGSGAIAIGRGPTAGESSDVVISSGGVTTGTGAGAGGNIALLGSAGPGVTISGQNNIAIGGGSGESASANDNNPNPGTHSNTILIGGGLTAANDQVIMIGRGATSTAANQCIIGGTFAPIATVIMGNGPVAAAPQNVILAVTDGSGVDINGGQLTIQGGRATGAAAGGSILFRTSIAGASGSTPQLQSIAMTIDATQTVNLVNAPFLAAQTAPGAVALTLLNGPTAAAAGNPQVYLTVKSTGHTYAIPAWQVA